MTHKSKKQLNKILLRIEALSDQFEILIKAINQPPSDTPDQPNIGFNEFDLSNPSGTEVERGQHV